MQYRILEENDAGFLTLIFSIPEYDTYFAENDTTEEEWKNRLTLFETEHSYVISKSGMDIGCNVHYLRRYLQSRHYCIIAPRAK